MRIPREPGFYILSHPDTGLYYVGSTINLYERFHVHMSTLERGNHKNPRLQEAYDNSRFVEYNFVVTKDRDEAYDLEQAFIDRNINTPRCCNIQTSARGGWKAGTVPHEYASRANAAAVAANKKREYARGWRHSDETRAKMSEAQLKRDPATFRRGFTVTDETRAKLRIANSRPRMKGREFSEEHRKNLSISSKARAEARKRPILATGIKYSCAGEAALALGVSYRTVINRILSDKKIYDDYSYL